MNRKLFVIVGALLLVIIASVSGWFILGRKQPKNSQNTSVTSTTTSTKNAKSKIDTKQPSTQQTEKVRLIAVGDMLPHDAINLRAKTANGYDYLQFFSPEVQGFFKKADVHFCNDEVPIAGDVFAISGYPVFNAPTKFANDIHTLGCDVINTANNHAFDKGQAGITQTRKVWDQLGVKAVAGANSSQAQQDTIAYFTQNSIKFAFLAYAEYSNIKTNSGYAVNLYSADMARKQVSEARKNADVVLVSMHWGTEDVQAENDFQKNAAQVLANSGADVVIGTGPHVLQPVTELAKQGGGKTLVWYSIGNFLNAQLDIHGLIGGLATMDFVKDSSGVTMVSKGFLPTYMHYEWTPDQKAVQDLLARRNFMLYPLDKAATPLSKSQNNTTVDAQLSNAKAVLNRYISVPFYDSNSF
ncbi:MAG: CapA family protein [Candidatus Saccharimonadales bacterium]